MAHFQCQIHCLSAQPRDANSRYVTGRTQLQTLVFCTSLSVDWVAKTHRSTRLHAATAHPPFTSRVSFITTSRDASTFSPYSPHRAASRCAFRYTCNLHLSAVREVQSTWEVKSLVKIVLFPPVTGVVQLMKWFDIVYEVKEKIPYADIMFVRFYKCKKNSTLVPHQTNSANDRQSKFQPFRTLYVRLHDTVWVH